MKKNFFTKRKIITFYSKLEKHQNFQKLKIFYQTLSLTGYNVVQRPNLYLRNSQTISTCHISAHISAHFLLKMGPLYSNLYNTEAPIVYTSGFLQYKNELGLDLKNDKRIVWEHVCTAACINWGSCWPLKSSIMESM